MGDATGMLSGVRIAGLACSVPDNLIENSAYHEKFGSEHMGKFEKMTGVKQHYAVLPGQTGSDLAFDAAARIIDAFGFTAEGIDGIIYVSEFPDYFSPATACVLHHRLSLKKECIAFDMNLGCSGFVYGLFVAASMCRNQGLERILLCGGTCHSMVSSQEDKSTAMLLGDAGYAVVLERDESGCSEWQYLLGTDGSGYNRLIIPAGAFRHPRGNPEKRVFGENVIRSDYDVYMDGMEIFNFAISTAPRITKRLMDVFGTGPDDFDLLVLHQANLFIQNMVSSRLKFKPERVPVCVDKYANTGGASIAVALSDRLGNVSSDESLHALLVGFGVGLSWGALSLGIAPSVCLPVARTREIFQDDVVGFDGA